MKNLFVLIGLMLIVAVGLGFAASNAETVTIHYYFGYLTAPLSLVLVVALAAGTIVGVLTSLGMIAAQQLQLSSLRKKISLCEREVQNLREIPIKEQQ